MVSTSSLQVFKDRSSSSLLLWKKHHYWETYAVHKG